MKTAKVIPIFKSGDQSIISNYRPVSVLNSFSKIFEKVYYKQLLNYLTDRNILYNFQFGFRPGHSTNLALTVLTDKISEALDNDDLIIGVFLDLSKAFDTVNHNILIKKLNYYGISDTPLRWVTSYLTNRKQYVSYANVDSSQSMCVCGVPQGSILGPLFFLLYINDMINVSNTLFLILFADDSNAFIKGKNINHIIHQLNDELHKLTEWLVANRLTLNLKKTHYVIFSSAKNNKHIYDDLIINNKVIDRVVSTKFLGVIIDAQLKFREHIAQIKGKIARGIGILCRAKKFFNIKTLTDLYYSFVHPYLSYCVEFWGNTNTTYINPLIKLQKRAVRIITGANQLCSTDGIFKMLKIIPLAKLHTLAVFLFLYKVVNTVVPSTISSMFVFNRDVHDHDTRQANNIHVDPVHCDIRIKCICYQATTLYNCSDGFNYNVSYQCFKYVIKHLLLDI